MSFIAGYYSINGKINSDTIHRKLKSFAIIPSENPQDYEHIVHEGKHGHLLAKIRKDAPTNFKYCR